MPTIEEMTTWTIEDIQVELKKLLPEKWVFRHIFEEEGIWKALVVDLSDEKRPVARWEGESLDERVLLFDAYGWLFTRMHPPEQRKKSPWRPRRGELTQEAVTRQVTLGQEPVPDPEDLDPNEVASVYKNQN